MQPYCIFFHPWSYLYIYCIFVFPIFKMKFQIIFNLNNKKMKNKQLIKILAALLFNICTSANSFAQSAPGTWTVLNQICHDDGVLAVNITSGLTPPLSFGYYNVFWNFISIHSNVNSLNDTLFGIPEPIGYVYVTDVLGNYYSSQISMPPPFQIDPPIVTHAICPNLGAAQLTINGGTVPASVQWNSYVYPGPPTIFGSGNPINLPSGMYTALVTDGSGCTVSTPIDSGGYGSIVIENLSGINFSVPTTSANCTNGTAAVTSISGGIAPYTYLWSNGANTPSISNLSQGSYAVTVTDAQGCNSPSSFYVQQAIQINVNTTVTDATCLQSDGAIISFGAGGTPPYTYQYSNGMIGQTVNGISGYSDLSVIATDANGCIGTGYAYVSSSTPINVSYATTNSSCTAATGSATLAIFGGTVPYVINWYTFPVQTGVSINSMAAGPYSFKVTDAAGCVRTGTAIIAQQSIINATASASNPFCPATTGDVSVNASGTNPPFTYLWNTNATGSVIVGAPLGYYSCVITDNVGCSLTKSVHLTTTTPINIGLSGTSASCIYTNDGAVLANATGGTAPYTYNWSNGQTAPNATGLATGNYYVYAQDANGCAGYKYTFVNYNASNTSCYCTITGKVYVDLNNNCIFDSGEQGIEHIMIHCSGFGYSFTDANGDYSFAVPSGTYTLSESVQSIYPLATCQNNAVVVSVTASSGCVSTTNFANTAITIHDIHIVRTNISFAIPGNTHTQGLIVQNDGTVAETNIQLGKKHDGQLAYVSSSPSVFTQLSPIPEPNWYSVTSGFTTLAPGASTMIYTDYLVPTNIPIGTDVSFWDSAAYAAPMTNWLSDYTPWNNVDNGYTTVIGSYDPNCKEVTPKGTGNQGYIATTDSVLDYVVHFQNSGSYYAEKVVVMDTLDTDLDWSSLKVGYSDHDYVATISESGVLKFTFNNIHLLWQSSSEMASRGLVSYSITQNPNLSPGTSIKNSAAIYFDYNEPVITNQTLNTIQFPAGVEDLQSVYDLSVYPNPATNELNIKLSNAANASVINIYDLQGRLLLNENITNKTNMHKVNISLLVNGCYFVVVEKNDGQKISAKFMKN